MINDPSVDPTKEYTCHSCEYYLKQGRSRVETAVVVQTEKADWKDMQALRKAHGWQVKYPIPRIEDGEVSGEDDPNNYPTVAVMKASDAAAREFNRDPAAPTALRIIIDG